MISFRYHIVSIVSVFLALAVGIALGGGPLKGEVDNTLVDQVKADRQLKTSLQSQIRDLRSADAFNDQFAATAAPGLVDDVLNGRVVTLVVLPTAQQQDVTALTKLIGVAGGRVGGTLRVGSQLLDAGDKQLVDGLANQLRTQEPTVPIPAAATTYERIGALIARAIGTRRPGGAPVDTTASTILSSLSTASLMSAEGQISRRGQLVLFVTGAGSGGADRRAGAGAIVTSLVRTVDARTGGVVLAGPVSAGRAGGEVEAVRDDVGTARDVSTVDTLGRTAGQVVTVLALAGQAAGQAGQFGTAGAADGAMPGASRSAP